MASQDAVEFISRMEKGRASVCQLLQSESSACIVKNRAILKSILKAIVFCGRHCEQRESNSNPGNFRALVNLRIDAGDLILADHFKTCARNAQYISPQIH